MSELWDDGILVVEVEDASKIECVLLRWKNKELHPFGRWFYPEEEDEE